ncbi:MAG: hypothetical protein ABIW84_03435, partial [Ilumatobacteraceae bacterium]
MTAHMDGSVRSGTPEPRRRAIGTVIGVVLLVTLNAACASDDSASTRRSGAVDQFVADATEQDIEVNKACVATVMDQFSDADFAIIDDDVTNSDVDALTPPGQSLIVQLVNCTGGRPGGTIPAPGGLSTAQTLILEQITASFDAQGLSYDRTCVADVVNSVDTA